MNISALTGVGPLVYAKGWLINGTLSNVGSVTVTIVDGNGTVIVTDAATTINSDVKYEYSLPIQTKPTRLYMTWKRSDTGETLDDVVDVDGSVLFTESEARALNISGLQLPLSSETDYPDDVIARWRSVITDMLERRCSRAFTRRYARVEMPGNGRYELLIGRHGVTRCSNGDVLDRRGSGRDIAAIQTVTVDGVTITPANIKIGAGGTLYRTDGVWSSPSTADPLNVIVEYEYGPAQVPTEARENALRLLLSNVIPSDLGGSEVASRTTSDGTTYKLTVFPRRVQEFIDNFVTDVQVF